MKKEVRCFIVNRKIATTDSTTVSPVYELSRSGHTFSRRVQERTVPDNDEDFLFSFHYGDDNDLTREEAGLIVQVVSMFVEMLRSVGTEHKPSIIANFMNYYNNSQQTKLSDFNYNSLILHNKQKYPDYLTFTIDNKDCMVWLSDETFKLFYPKYDINVIPPFKEFPTVVKCVPEMLAALAEFNLVKFISSLNDHTNGIPSTVNEALNIPYRASKESPLNDCYFGFNIYGLAGNYEYILKEEVYDYLSKELDLTDEFIEEHFPTLFQVNEFFIVPSWNKYAIPFTTGQGSINSQINKAWGEPFYMPKYVPVYENSNDYIRGATYNVPVTYNNLMLQVVNGKYTRDEEKDFLEFYPDIITVNTTDADFARMSTKTQRFLVFLNQLIAVADANNQTELFNNIMNNREHQFRISNRKDTIYVSVFYDKHRYYIMPRYEHDRITKGIK